ncbi:hypothetical protein Fuma_04407 [Fuerstiella marisgermanici]|uniref:Uncharacterized protein n=1 Tax=Fuerstiella marisgermanici TaxID=1891926 RepID=A0A1P8WL31_9PLAN|nr:hypothetical protein Fuma_04407 [Fuerstiella marisgermanici]
MKVAAASELQRQGKTAAESPSHVDPEFHLMKSCPQANSRLAQRLVVSRSQIHGWLRDRRGGRIPRCEEHRDSDQISDNRSACERQC